MHVLLKLLGRCNTSGRPCHFFGILEFAILSKIAIFPTKMYLTNQMFLAKMMSYFNFSSNLNMTKISTKLKTLFLTIETEVQYAIAHISTKKFILFCFSYANIFI